MAKETLAQQQTVERVMHEFKHHELKGSGGEVISDPKQAIAIGLREAGASDRVTPAQNRHAQARTRAHEATGPTSRSENGDAQGADQSRSDLYAEARKRDIPNRSKMNKAQLERALAKSPQR